MGSAYRYSSLPVPDLRFGPRIEALTAIQSLLHRQKTDSGGRYVVRQLPYPVMNARHCAVKCASMIRTSCASSPSFNFAQVRSEEHTSELQSRLHLVCRLLLEKKKKDHITRHEHLKLSST